MLEASKAVLSKGRNAAAFGAAGCASLILGNQKDAEYFSRKALNETPQDHRARFNLASSLLKQGRWLEGWNEYDARWKFLRKLPLQNIIPEWRGQRGRVVLVQEQGFGDTIMMMRFAKRIAEISGEMPDITCQPEVKRIAELTGLFRRVNEFVPDEWKWHVPMMGIAKALKLQPQDISGEPYVPRTSGRAGGVGFCWRGSEKNGIDHWRSMPDEVASQIVSGKMVGLCPGRTLPGLDDALAKSKDFFDTAQIISGLDLVVTVCSAVAHLSGALGVPTIVMLAKCSDWRWGEDGERTPWYDSVTLSRQERLGDWSGVVNTVKERCNRLYSGARQ